MTKFVLHRANDLYQSVLPVGFSGAEIDLRLHFGKLVLAHDPLTDGASLEEWLSTFTGDLVILNTKETGIEEMVTQVIASISPRIEYFFLDLPVPSLVKAINDQISVATRISEIEPISFSNKVPSSWIWLDSFSGDWSHMEELKVSRENFSQKICLVSPELQGRWPNIHSQEFEWLKNYMREHSHVIQAICTKDLSFWVG